MKNNLLYEERPLPSPLASRLRREKKNRLSTDGSVRLSGGGPFFGDHLPVRWVKVITTIKFLVFLGTSPLFPQSYQISFLFSWERPSCLGNENIYMSRQDNEKNDVSAISFVVPISPMRACSSCGDMYR